MFVRKKRNRSGTISVVVVDKGQGGFKEIKRFGVARSEEEAEILFEKASAWLLQYDGQQILDFDEPLVKEQEKSQTLQMLDNVKSVLLNAPQKLLSRIYDDIGFNGIKDEILRHLVIARICQPLAYSVFCGSQYEGFTMIPVVEDFVKRFNLEDFVVVADSGLMSKKNLALLQSGGYKYIILGARIRNEAADIREWILSNEKLEKIYYEQRKSTGDRLIVTYSEDRAKKDADNRKRGVARLKRAYASGVIKKESLNRRGYNKFLDITKDVGISINEDKVTDDARWDGWKGYLTNTKLAAEDVVSQYHGLWVVERAFRITKGNLEMRPIFHFTPRRIEAHICICFIAYKVYKEFERVIKSKGIELSVDKVLSIAKTIPTISIRMPHNKKTITQTLFLTEAHRLIQGLF